MAARRRIAMLVVLSTMIVVLAAGAAQAVSWGTIRAYYNGIARAEGSGNFYNENNVNATNRFTLNDPSNDGNNAYGYTLFYFYYSGGWYFGGRRDTGEYNYYNTPVTKYLRWPLWNYGIRARGSSRVCGQMGWPVPDVCSSFAQPTFTY